MNETLAANLLPADALHDAFNTAFADYLIGAPNLDRDGWRLFLRRQGIDIASSLVERNGDDVLAFALVCPIDAARVRLGTMGAVPAARGNGAAARLLDAAIAQAREQGAQTFELEVFAQNLRAVRLYRSRGFEQIVELFGYERAPGPSADAEPPESVALDAAEDWLRDADADIDGLPFQVSAAAIEASTAPLVAWRSGAAQLVFNPANPASIGVASFVDTDPQQAGAHVLAAALAAEYPQATLRVPQLQRRDLGGQALEDLGWTRLPLHQLLMRRALD